MSIEYYKTTIFQEFGPLWESNSRDLEIATEEAMDRLVELQIELENSDLEDLTDILNEIDDCKQIIIFTNIKLIIMKANKLPASSSKEDRDDYIQELIIRLFVQLDRTADNQEHGFKQILNFAALNVKNKFIANNLAATRFNPINYQIFVRRYERARNFILNPPISDFFGETGPSDRDIESFYYLTHKLSDKDFYGLSTEELEKLLELARKKNSSFASENLKNDREKFAGIFYYESLDHFLAGGIIDPDQDIDEKSNIDIDLLRRFFQANVKPMLLRRMGQDRGEQAIAILNYCFSFTEKNKSPKTIMIRNAAEVMGISLSRTERLYNEAIENMQTDIHILKALTSFAVSLIQLKPGKEW